MRPELQPPHVIANLSGGSLHGLADPVPFSRITGTLTAASKTSDAQILSLGDELGNAIEIFANLTSTFEALQQEFDSQALFEAAETLRKVSRSISEIGAALADEHAALVALATLGRKMGAHVNQLRQTIRTISILAVNAQIAAAGLRTEGESFSAFTGEITALTRDGQSTIEGYYKEFQDLDSLLASAITTQANFQRTQREALNSITQQLDLCLDEVDARRKRNAESAQVIGARSAQISREVGVIVSALQIGDITRQRLEHVCEALEHVEDELGGAPSGDAPDAFDAGQKDAILRGVARFQARQIGQSTADFRTEIDRVAGALKGLANDADVLVGASGEIAATVPGTGISFLHDLRQKLEATQALSRDCVNARKEIQNVIGVVSASLNKLLGQVKAVTEIEADMRLVGLNMGFRCARLGTEGDVLRVIAQELRANARRILGDTEALQTSVNAVIAGAERLSSGAGAEQRDALANVEGDTKRALAIFDNAGTRLDDALAALTESGQRVGGILAGAAEQASRLGDAAAALDEARADLEQFSDGDVPPEHEDVVNDWIARRMKAQYTMASERTIHTEFALAAPESSSANTQGSTADAASIDDFLF